jgi:tetratricopeptide (TPR) repeat protein
MLLPDSDLELRQAEPDAASLLLLQVQELRSLLSLNPTACSERAAVLAEAAHEAGDPVSEMKAVYFRALALLVRGDLAAAESWMSRAHDLSVAHGDATWYATTLAGIGLVLKGKGRYDEALERLSLALEQFRAIDHKPGIADCLGNLGGLLTVLEVDAEGLAMLREARDIDIETGNASRAAMKLRVLALCHVHLAIRARRQCDAERQREEAARARDLMHQALREDRSEVNPDTEASGLLALGHAGLLLDDTATVQQALGGLDTLLASCPIPHRELDRDVLMAKLQRSLGRFDEAVSLIGAVLALCDEHGRAPVRLWALEELAETLEAQGDYAAALHALRQSHLEHQTMLSSAARERAKLLTQHLQAQRERHRGEIQALMERRAQLRAASGTADG